MLHIHNPELQVSMPHKTAGWCVDCQARWEGSHLATLVTIRFESYIVLLRTVQHRFLKALEGSGNTRKGSGVDDGRSLGRCNTLEGQRQSTTKCSLHRTMFCLRVKTPSIAFFTSTNEIVCGVHAKSL